MEVQAITKNVRMSAQKMREVVRQIQGMRVEDALAVLSVVPRKGARVVAKTLQAAKANADDLQAHFGGLNRKIRRANLRAASKPGAGVPEIHKEDFERLNTGNLRVKLAVAGAATTLRRFTPKARGSAGPILKRNCHVKIVLSDE
jgi:large subunit ribosomal protein L22